MKWDIYKAEKMTLTYGPTVPAGVNQPLVTNETIGYLRVPVGCDIRESRFDGHLGGLVITKMEDETDGCEFCGITGRPSIHGTCEYCGEEI